MMLTIQLLKLIGIPCYFALKKVIFPWYLGDTNKRYMKDKTYKKTDLT